ncbi:MAG: DUF308 domain-containing protein [Paracoccaceae bacterium]
MRNGTLLSLLGVVMMIGGVLALANPFAASLAVTSLVGAFLIFSGAVQLWMAIADTGHAHRWWTGLVAVVALVAGVSLLANPLQGLISLTLLVGITLLIMGIARLAMAFRLRETRMFWPLLLSGAVSALVGLMVISNIMAAATTLLGVLLGIQLLADGVALVALGLMARRAG